MSDTTERRHQHAEAFHVMRYRCQACGHLEHIWNSRDGVTPFSLSCPQCNPERDFRRGTMVHVNWQMDVYAPHYQPPAGSLVFVGKPEEPSLQRLP